MFEVILVLIFPIFPHIRSEYGEISISLYSVRMRENVGKMWTRITLNMDTFYAVNNLVSEKVFLDSSAYILCLTLSWRRSLSYRNQSIDLLSKSMGWFLYDNGLRHERVKGNKNQFIHEFNVMLHKIAVRFAKLSTLRMVHNWMHRTFCKWVHLSKINRKRFNLGKDYSITVVMHVIKTCFLHCPQNSTSLSYIILKFHRKIFKVCLTIFKHYTWNG